MATVTLEFILFGALLQQPQTGYELQRFMEAQDGSCAPTRR